MSQKGLKLIAFLGFAAAGLSANQAFAAMTTLKQVQVSNGSQIDLLFDGKVGKSQARTEFFNDVIQISLNDVSVYPAKISSVNGGPLVKIFAYQYAPKLVRCRLTVNGKAEDYKDRLQIVTNGKVLSLRLAGAEVKADQISVQAAHPVTKAAAKASSKEDEKAADVARASAKQEKAENQPREIEAAKADAGQAALLERVMKTAPSKPVPVSIVKDADAKDGASERSRKNSLSGAKPLPSPMGVMMKLLAVIGLFGAMAFIAKKFFHGKGVSIGSNRNLNARLARSAGGEGGWMTALGGFARSAAAGLGRKDKMIEVLSNHYLGPKKSIAVVRIMGRTLVLGVTNDSINLISQIAQTNEAGAAADDLELGDDENVDLESLIAQGALSSAMGKATVANRSNAAPVQNKQTRVSAQVPNTTSRPLPGMDFGGPAASNFAAMMQQEVKKPANGPSVRNQIRSRLEGLKQL
ncbi:MAG: flagellar biosynthetic protein FliO [Bdellovibrionia bacterium]